MLDPARIQLRGLIATMCFTLCCTDCGHRMKVTEDHIDKEIKCEKCGAVIHYRVHDNTALVRIEKYASMLLPDRRRTLKIVCPVCGYKYARSATGTYTETRCPKCKSGFSYSVKDNEVYVELESPSDKRPTTK